MKYAINVGKPREGGPGLILDELVAVTRWYWGQQLSVLLAARKREGPCKTTAEAAGGRTLGYDTDPCVAAGRDGIMSGSAGLRPMFALPAAPSQTPSMAAAVVPANLSKFTRSPEPADRVRLLGFKLGGSRQAQ